MKYLQCAAVLLLAILFVAVTVSAQTDMPRNGACFYKDPNYRGSYFCAQAGESYENLPAGFNDRIRSVRIFGNAQVQAFNDNRFAGSDVTLSNDVPDLHALPMAVDPRANWTERFSSLRVSATNDRGFPRWGNNAATTGGVGACFFEHPNYVGRSFCVDRGKALDNFPAGFRDGIQSIRVFGDSEVQIFSENNFTGLAARTRRDIPELRAWSIPDNPSRKWGEDIASVRVDVPRNMRWNNSGGYRDDDTRGAPDRNLVRCTSQPGDRPQYCNSRGYARDAYMINSYGTCRKGVTWGIDNGRLWVSNGCAADFQVQQ